MGAFDDIQADIEEQKRQAAARLYEQGKSAIQAGKISYDEKELKRAAQAGGVDIPPPASMPLAPELTRSADRQKFARRRRRGRASTMLTSTLGEETLG